MSPLASFLLGIPIGAVAMFLGLLAWAYLRQWRDG